MEGWRDGGMFSKKNLGTKKKISSYIYKGCNPFSIYPSIRPSNKSVMNNKLCFSVFFRSFSVEYTLSK